LIELVIVMAVMAVILAVTAPNLAGFVHGRSVREEARRLVAVTRRAAAVASSQSCRTRVWLEPSTGSYGWRRVETYDTDGADDVSFTVAEGIELTVSPAPEEGTCEVTFRPDGGVDVVADLRMRFAAGPASDASEVTFDADRGIFVVAEDEDQEDGQ